MKIAIAAMGKDKDSEVSPVGGRAPYYLIFENKDLIEVVKNPFRMGGGAGFGVAQMLIDKGAEIVVCGKFGHNMQMALEEKGIKIKTSSKKVKEVLEEINA